MSNLDDIYAGIEKAEEQKQERKDGPRDFLKIKPGETLLVRLVPYVADYTRTFVEYDYHGWNSVDTREYVTTGVCPRGKDPKASCPVCKDGYAAYERKELLTEPIGNLKVGELKSKLLLAKTTRMVNVFVIDDSANPSNNGQVKILRYGTQLDGIIRRHALGDLKAEYGRACFDLSKDGVTLKIICERKGGSTKAPPTYENSVFVRSEGKIDLSKEEEEAIFAQAKDLTTFIPKTKSDDEIEKILARHFHGEKSKPLPVDDTDEDDDTNVADLLKESADSAEDDKAVIDNLLDSLEED